MPLTTGERQKSRYIENPREDAGGDIYEDYLYYTKFSNQNQLAI